MADEKPFDDEYNPLLPQHHFSPDTDNDGETLSFRRRWVVALLPRDTEEPRTSTSLELLFDLIFAVAVSQSADGFQEKFLDGHTGVAVFGLFFTFFALWWPWASYVFFASAYDNDDLLFRCYVFVQMVGALFVAQGVKKAYDRDLTVMVIGYVILRVAQLTMWYLVSRTDRRHKKFAIRQVWTLIFMQTAWCGGLAVNIVFDRPEWYWYMLPLGVVAELGGYILCARGVSRHPMHLEHVVDRFGEFSLIVLGETVLSWSASLNESSFLQTYHPALGMVAAAAFLGTLSLWWTYFDFPFELEEHKANVFAVMHYFVFTGITGFGASIRIAIASTEGLSIASRISCSYVIAVSMVGIIMSHWILRFWFLRCAEDKVEKFGAPLCAVLMLLFPLFALIDTNIAFGASVLLVVMCNVVHVACFVVRDMQHDHVVCREQRKRQSMAMALNESNAVMGTTTSPVDSTAAKQKKHSTAGSNDDIRRLGGDDRSFIPKQTAECSTQTEDDTVLTPPPSDSEGTTGTTRRQQSRRQQKARRGSGAGVCPATDFASVTVTGIELPPDQDDSVCHEVDKQR